MTNFIWFVLWSSLALIQASFGHSNPVYYVSAGVSGGCAVAHYIHMQFTRRPKPEDER